MTRQKPLSASVEAFLAEPLSATLTTIRPDGSLHAVPVRFTWESDVGLARIMTVDSSRKVRNLSANPGSRVALCQVDGFRWITLEGTATVSNDSREVADGVSRYTRRYQSPPPNPPGRVVVTIAVDRVMTLNT
ncbi:TIGR03618 family F420-dependent PPOX class oxidoreductase [Nocardia sp. NBC_00881]|uniref:pyridoxamine 5'-phosphate oxidase family protein n=1 Tax=Nocardia sp. NBC_00881 TaxID=2975995 RepID=UPI0038676B17|nr:TIGR03618 family F420-dependent PPOX class oxidoreductase [Nocardia sp. NBC_00881]